MKFNSTIEVCVGDYEGKSLPRWHWSWKTQTMVDGTHTVLPSGQTNAKMAVCMLVHPLFIAGFNEL